MTTLRNTQSFNDRSFKDIVVWRPIAADLTFWGVTGAIVAAAAGPLGDLFGIAPKWLVIVGVVFVAAAIPALYLLNRSRAAQLPMLWSLAIFNAVLAPFAWIAALLGWFPLTTAGNWGLAAIGDVALVLAIYQFNGLRLRRSARRA